MEEVVVISSMALEDKIQSNGERFYLLLRKNVGACVCVLSCFSHVQLCATLWTVAHSRLLCPWDFPGKNTGVGCHALP